MKKVSDSKVTGNIVIGNIVTGDLVSQNTVPRDIPRGVCLGIDSGSAEELSREEKGLSRRDAEGAIQFFGHE